MTADSADARRVDGGAVGDVDEDEVPALAQLRSFVGFFVTWAGLLATLTLFFPFSNRFTEILPLETTARGGALSFFTPAQITAITTLFAVSVMVHAFSGRENYGSREKHEEMRTAFRHYLIFAALLMIACLVLVAMERDDAFPWLHQRFSVFGDLGLTESNMATVFDFPMALAYTGNFALLTRAFVVLGMSEYVRSERAKRKKLASGSGGGA